MAKNKENPSHYGGTEEAVRVMEQHTCARKLGSRTPIARGPASVAGE